MTKMDFKVFFYYLAAKFRKYDYGLIRNLQKYGWGTPPAYDLKKVTAPVALHYSDNDWMAHSKVK